jgi:hypothetical protein
MKQTDYLLFTQLIFFIVSFLIWIWTFDFLFLRISITALFTFLISAFFIAAYKKENDKSNKAS